jgi:F420-0:gamma-glutamyl ligase
MRKGLEVVPVIGVPEVAEGTDLAKLVGELAELTDGDVVSVTSKIVSKAEGRALSGITRAEAVDAEQVRLVAQRGDTRIVQTRHGLVLAAAGTDTSNAAPGTVLLLPVDPDASARALRSALWERYGVNVGVVVTDTLGRPWRNGQSDVAIGAAGIEVIEDLRGTTDSHGNTLAVTLPAVADELAAASELVKGKADGIPIAIVRGAGTARVPPRWSATPSPTCSASVPGRPPGPPSSPVVRRPARVCSTRTPWSPRPGWTGSTSGSRSLS